MGGVSALVRCTPSQFWRARSSSRASLTRASKPVCSVLVLTSFSIAIRNWRREDPGRGMSASWSRRVVSITSTTSLDKTHSLARVSREQGRTSCDRGQTESSAVTFLSRSPSSTRSRCQSLHLDRKHRYHTTGGQEVEFRLHLAGKDSRRPLRVQSTRHQTQRLGHDNVRDLFDQHA
jgi:hypothetical protein